MMSPETLRLEKLLRQVQSDAKRVGTALVSTRQKLQPFLNENFTYTDRRKRYFDDFEEEPIGLTEKMQQLMD